MSSSPSIPSAGETGLPSYPPDLSIDIPDLLLGIPNSLFQEPGMFVEPPYHIYIPHDLSFLEAISPSALATAWCLAGLATLSGDLMKQHNPLHHVFLAIGATLAVATAARNSRFDSFVRRVYCYTPFAVGAGLLFSILWIPCMWVSRGMVHLWSGRSLLQATPSLRNPGEKALESFCSDEEQPVMEKGSSAEKTTPVLEGQ